MQNLKLDASVGSKVASSLGVFFLLCSILLPNLAATAFAAAPGAVVINEVAWAGSVNSSADEWIELYNPGSAAVSLSGWKLKYNGGVDFTFPATASIAAQGYFLIEDSEAVTNVPADAIYNMSLSNSGASLQLVDAASVVIDTVNGSAGAWYAGSNTTHSTMERKDAVAGDVAGNFASSTGSGATASGGGAVVGTPRAANSVAVVSVSAPAVSADWSAASAVVGDNVKLTIKVNNVSDLFAYGLELNYDPAVLQYQTAVAHSFLNASGTVSTAFQSGLKGGVAGDLLLAEARTIDPKVGVNGNGELLEVNFKVIGGAASSAAVSFVNGSFLSSTTADISASWAASNLTIGGGVVNPVTTLTAEEGAARYQIKLSWTASNSSPDHYRVERMDAHGNYVVLGGVTGTEFVDQDTVVGGGKIIPGLTYHYRVSAVKGSLVSVPVEIAGVDLRGVKGDNNRSDLVDGRDLQSLAKHFAELDSASTFDVLVDTTYDGRIDGSDLIDIGANFAKKF